MSGSSKGHVGRVLRILGLVGAAGCGDIVHNSPDAGAPRDGAGQPPDDGGGGGLSNLAECKAQRAVYLAGGNGGFAWFTLAWPVPAVITGYQATFAFDDPQLVADVTSAGQISHPLFARKIGTRTLWQGLGTAPEPSVLISGTNQTHTSSPSNLSSPVSVFGEGAVLQAELAPVIAALSFSSAASNLYGGVAGAPPISVVTTTDAAVHLFDGKITAAQQAQLTPSAEQLGRYVPAGGTTAESSFGSQLAFTANALKLGLITTMIIPAFNDDPHGAFAGGNAIPTSRANNLAAMLDAFYADLAAAPDPSCSHGGRQISLADNVVTLAFGDTPKNSFARDGWPDGTPGNSNWIYLRSNGFLKPGWFGVIQSSSSRINFNPTTGLADPNVVAADATASSYAAVLYAIARGDSTKVTAVTASPYAGLILK